MRTFRKELISLNVTKASSGVVRMSYVSNTRTRHFWRLVLIQISIWFWKQKKRVLGPF